MKSANCISTTGRLLAAVTANESEGRRASYRFIPELHDKLAGLLRGTETKVEGVTKAQLEKYLGTAETEGEKAELLKRLAGLHGYTQLPGYFCAGWKLPLDALTDKERQFELAIRRLDEITKEHKLPPDTNPADLGRYWSSAPMAAPAPRCIFGGCSSGCSCIRKSAPCPRPYPAATEAAAGRWCSGSAWEISGTKLYEISLDFGSWVSFP